MTAQHARPEQFVDPTHPFARADGIAAGLGRQLRTSSYRRLLHGIYVLASVPATPLLRAEAALVPFGPMAWASHATAARVLALPIPPLPGASGPGATLARQAAVYVRERVDSPMETRLRMLLVLAGLPEPEVNVLVGDGVAFRKYDLSYRRSKTIVEYDGRQHAERIEQWESDLERREAIDDDEWRILVVISSGIYRSPGKTLERIHRVLLRGGEPGTPRTLSDAWRLHFPGYD